MTKQIYGYIRVSSKDQNEDRQLIALQEYKIPKSNIYIDKISGKDFERPQYKKLLRRLKAGNLLIIKSIDRLGRNYEDVLEQWKFITKQKKVDIKIIDMPLLDTTISKDLLGTFIADLVLQLLSFVAENERTVIKSRQAEGIAAAKARGVRFGRPEKSLPPDFDHICSLWEKHHISTREALNKLKMPRATFYRKFRKHFAQCSNSCS